MKTLVLAATLATLIGAPAFAQSFDPNVGTGNIAPIVTENSPDGVFRYPTAHEAHSAYAQAPAGARSQRSRTFIEPNARVAEPR